ncbi:hypothetical protein [Neobacillus sp. PS3-40]|uniref:hypothetical protein n=1 Tax=Neobacillus sp. PS3-40 TaxID=3070679 RepID=UPI0027E0FD61|nr:hypothetical protein [Neobacillus sp. PS3-40]WML46173.1 hypothetical protein RCG20_09890 [Neobacillus sp. PS3-40]
MKKKAIKIAAASAVAASAFVAAAPLQSNAASNVTTTVDNAVKQMQVAYHTYSDVTANGQFADINSVYKELNAAKVAYTSAKALVVKAGGAQKDANLAKLDDNYNTYITKRVVTYVDAYNYAVKNLVANKDALKVAIDAKNLVDVQKYYNEISYQLNKRTVILDRVYGQTTRDLLKSSYKADAQALKETMKYDVTVAVKVKAVTDAIAAGKLDVAKAAVDQINLNLPKVTETFKADLTTKATAAVAAYEATQTPAVVSVSAINAKEVKVTFNKAVDATTAQNPANYAVTLVGGAALGFTPTLQADGKSVILTFGAGDSLTNTATNYVVSVSKNVLTVDGKQQSADYQNVVSLSDAVRPSVASASMVDANTLKVLFSEPVNLSAATAAAATKIYSSTNADVTPVVGNFAVGTDAATGNTFVTIDVSGLTRGASFKLDMYGVADYANNLLTPNPYSTNFSTVNDTTAPTVASVTSLNLSQAKVVFSEPIKEATAGLKDYFQVSLDGGAPVTTSAANVSTTDGKTFTLNVAALNLVAGVPTNLTAGLHTITVSAVHDLAGLPMAAASTNYVTFTAQAPTITNTVGQLKTVGGVNYIVFPVDRGVNVTVGSQLTLGYVDINGYVQNNITVKDALNANIKALDLNNDGVTDAIGINADDYDGVAANAQALPAGTYTATIGNIVKDTAANPNSLANTNVSFAISGAAATGTVTGALQTLNAPNTVTVTYSKPVTSSALTLSNYQIDGHTIATNAVFVGDNQHVRLTLASGVLPYTTNYQFTVNNVVDTTGKAITAYNQVLPFIENTAPTYTASLTGLNSLNITFSEAVGATLNATDDLVVKVNGNTVTLANPVDTGDGIHFTVAKSDASNFISNVSDVVTVQVVTGATQVVDAAGNASSSTVVTSTK